MSLLKLEFSIPEEHIESQQAIYGSSLVQVFHRLDNYLRDLEKHQDVSLVKVAEVRAALMAYTTELGIPEEILW